MSYSWSSVAHEQWVIELAEELTSDGVHVVLDKWDLKEGQDKYAFMERMVTDPALGKVLMVRYRRYAEKADGRKGLPASEPSVSLRHRTGFVDTAKQESYEDTLFEPPCLRGF